MDDFYKECRKYIRGGNFGYLSLGIIDFVKKDFHCFGPQDHYYDLASLTKPLTLGVAYLKQEKHFTSELCLLLNHRGGLPSGGRLSKYDWRSVIMAYQIKESATLYSDFSALRLMLELEKKIGHDLHAEISSWWDKEIMFWKDLPEGRTVQDPNAQVINAFCSHAGLFGTIGGVCRTLLNLQNTGKLLSKMESALQSAGPEDRFVLGWDRVIDHRSTLAGSAAGPRTFGHLGFSGTSIWIDLDAKRGAVILTNASEQYWYDRDVLNNLRRQIGNLIWNWRE